MMTPKTVTVAISEYTTAVRSKAFIIGVVAMPVMMAAFMMLQRTLMTRVDRTERSFAVIDHTGVLYAPLARAAEARDRDLADPQKKMAGARFVPVRVEPDGRRIEQTRLDLSDQIRRKETFAFVEIPADVLDPSRGEDRPIRYHSNQPTYDALPRWVESALNREILVRRFQAASIDPELVRTLNRPVATQPFSLLQRDPAGRVKEAEQVDRVRTFALPAGLMMVIFLLVMTSTPQLLNTVLEEKMSRISEVMLGSVAPFELMLGKLLASVAMSVSLVLMYFAGAFVVLPFWFAEIFTPGLFVAFIGYLTLAVLLFGSLFISIGAACTDMKDAQSMMTPAMLFVMIPAFTWPAVLRAPDSTIAIALSLFPPSAPFIMLLRLSLPLGVPIWQVGASLALTIATTIGMVWAAGKIFRTGILMHGKSATFTEMIRWVRAA